MITDTKEKSQKNIIAAMATQQKDVLVISVIEPLQPTEALNAMANIIVSQGQHGKWTDIVNDDELKIDDLFRGTWSYLAAELQEVYPNSPLEQASYVAALHSEIKEKSDHDARKGDPHYSNVFCIMAKYVLDCVKVTTTETMAQEILALFLNMSITKEPKIETPEAIISIVYPRSFQGLDTRQIFWVLNGLAKNKNHPHWEAMVDILWRKLTTGPSAFMSRGCQQIMQASILRPIIELDVSLIEGISGGVKERVVMAARSEVKRVCDFAWSIENLPMFIKVQNLPFEFAHTVLSYEHCVIFTVTVRLTRHLQGIAGLTLDVQESTVRKGLGKLRTALGQWADLHKISSTKFLLQCDMELVENPRSTKSLKRKVKYEASVF